MKAIRETNKEVNQVEKYKVIVPFGDLQDNSKPYKVGDSYPRPANKKITKKRIEELSTNNNPAGKPFIEEVVDNKGE